VAFHGPPTLVFVNEVDIRFLNITNTIKTATHKLLSKRRGKIGSDFERISLHYFEFLISK
jgi:hypothetical protein